MFVCERNDSQGVFREWGLPEDPVPSTAGILQDLLEAKRCVEHALSQLRWGENAPLMYKLKAVRSGLWTACRGLGHSF